MEKIRSFIAMELAPQVREQLRDIQARLKPLDLDVSWVKPENIHITLKFLGEVPDKKIHDVQDSLPGIFKNLPPFPIALGGLGAFPQPERARVIWVGLSEGEDRVKAAAETLEHRLGLMGFTKEARGFTAHLTLGRVKSGKNLPRLVQAIQDLTPPHGARQTVSRIVLFKSTLHSSGSIYEPLSAVSLQ
ncbi:MAG: RNA 2',3'-cyclic phosphodiesterase [Candidatus Omnitrophota bacterium]|nr:RNA 2',3'-cyclic phosphodiesterase [Candidatus Omnitrophota bacterium]MDZ4242937.1 RNA 2',3'-cyclic phosphodiesterase [Candidatus Omnitrophota bacterium]